MKPDTEENHQNIILNCSTNDINDNWEPQVRVEEIIELTNSITKESNSSVTFSSIVPIVGKWNEKVDSVNHLLQTYCRNTNILYVGYEIMNQPN